MSFARDIFFKQPVRPTSDFQKYYFGSGKSGNLAKNRKCSSL